MKFVPNAPAKSFGAVEKSLVLSVHPSTGTVSISSDVENATVVAQPNSDNTAVSVLEVLPDGSDGEVLQISVVKPEATPAA